MRIVVPGDTDDSEDQIYHDPQDVDYDKATDDHEGTNRVRTNEFGGNLIYHDSQSISYGKAMKDQEVTDKDHANDFAGNLIYHDPQDINYGKVTRSLRTPSMATSLRTTRTPTEFASTAAVATRSTTTPRTSATVRP